LRAAGDSRHAERPNRPPLHDVRQHARFDTRLSTGHMSRARGISFLTNELLMLAADADNAGDAAAWWSQTGSNRRPPACKAGALPTELWPRLESPPSLKLRRATFAVRRLACQPKRRQPRRLVGLGRFELPTSRLSSARSNQLSYKPGPGNFSHRKTSNQKVI
jgi:hypothetical protein